jgi:toxin ParE1/3/4
MAYTIVWSPSAIADVNDLAQYIARDSVAYASAVVAKLLEATRTLENFPVAGRIVPEFNDKAIREKLVYSYRVIYRIEGSTVTIITVIHGKRVLNEG